MKKVGIITHYDVHNHGALLQLTALKRVLKDHGIEAVALQFDKNYDFLGKDLKSKYEISIKSIGIYIKYMREKGIGCTLYNYRKRNTLGRYKSDARLIGPYYSESDKLDAVIVGSDEVFALHTGPTPVFFGHALPTDVVVSYAGCFGPTTFEDIERRHCTEFVRSGLMGMKGVTVRDKNSADIVERLTMSRPSVVVDPVLLYGFKSEKKSVAKIKGGDYLLVYSYDNRMNDPLEVEAIKSYAASKGLKVVSAGFYHAWCDENVDVDPIGLLAYFRDASAVVTDTFHGAVMSIIMGASFAVKVRESNRFKLECLLAEYGLSHLIFSCWEDMPSVIAREIDWKGVETELGRRRDDSLNALKNLLGI